MKRILIFSLLFFGLSHTNLYPSLEITLRKISGPKSSNDATKNTKCIAIRTLLASAVATSQNTAYNNPLLFHKSEYLDANYTRNERNQKGVGFRLYDEVYDKIEVLSKKPNSHSTFYKEFRKASLKVFPFVIIYIIKTPFILIFAIWHKSRDSKKLLERIEKVE